MECLTLSRDHYSLIYVVTFCRRELRAARPSHSQVGGNAPADRGADCRRWSLDNRAAALPGRLEVHLLKQRDDHRDEEGGTVPLRGLPPRLLRGEGGHR